MSRCVFCGENLTDQGQCPNIAQHFKPMCLNCEFCQENEENHLCLNEENKNDAIQKIMTSYEGGYKITNIELSPIPLKDATKKCKRYLLSTQKIINQLSK